MKGRKGMDDERLRQIVREVATEWQVGGFDPDDISGEFAMQVAKRALLADIIGVHEITTSSGTSVVRVEKGKMTLIEFRPATQPGSPDEQPGSRPPQGPSEPRQ